MIVSRVVLKLTVAASIIACDSPPNAYPSHATTTDSGGISIVEVVPNPGSADVHIRDYDEVFAIPLSDDHDLADVTAARLINGGIAATVNNFTNVLLIDSVGAVVQRLGSRGEGPGEFLDMGALLPSDNAIVIYDRRLRRLTTFDSLGTLLGTTNAGEQFGGAPGVAFAYAHRDTLLVLRLHLPNQDGHVRPSASVESYYRGRLLHSIENLRGREQFVQRRGQATRSLPVPFGRDLIVRPTPSGVMIAETETAELRTYDFALRPQNVFRINIPPERLTSADLDRHVDSVLAQYSDPIVRRTTEEGIRARHVHDVGPAIAEVIVGNDGEIWWRLDASDDVHSVYYVFEPEGTFCCAVSLEGAVQLFDVNEGAVLFLRRQTGGGEELVLLQRSLSSR